MQYYFIGTSLPALYFDVKPEISFHDFDRLLQDNLSEKDYKKVLVIRRLYDLLNLKAFWQSQPLNPYGTLDENELAEGLLDQVTFPDYVYDFAQKHESNKDRIKHFPELLSAFFRGELKNETGIMRQGIEFERQWRLVLAAFRAKKLGRDLSEELQYEDPEEELIAEMLAQKDAKEFELPENFKELKSIFERHGDDPLQLQKALDEFRFNFLGSLIDMADNFSIERILVYMTQLLILERWAGYDKEQGLEIIKRLKV